MPKAFIGLIIIYFLILLKPSTLLAAETIDTLNLLNYDYRFDGATAGDKLGRYIIKMADVNGNGIDDVLIGTPNTTYNGTDSGSVYIIHDDLLNELASDIKNLDMSDNNNYSLRIDGPMAGTYLGYDSAFDVADITGDGKLDILVSGPYLDFNSKNSSGSIYIISNTILNQNHENKTVSLYDESNYTWRIDGAASGDGLGDGTLTTGDVDMDGKTDVLISAWEADNNGRSRSGSVYLIFGKLIQQYPQKNIDLSNPESFSIRYDGVSSSHNLGFAGSKIADVTGDNKPDVLIPGNMLDKGSVWIVSNSLIDYDSIDHTKDLLDSDNYSLLINGANSYDYFGLLGINAADLDGNGYNDLTIASVYADFNSKTDSGSVYVFYDALIKSLISTTKNVSVSDSDNYTLRLDGAFAGDKLGLWGTLADLNNDNKVDIVANAWDSNYLDRTNAGSIYIFYNDLITGLKNIKTVDIGETYFSLRYVGSAINSYMGSGGVATGDVNGDGGTDILLTSIYSDHNEKTDSGSVYLILGDPPPETENTPQDSGPYIRYRPEIWANTYGAVAEFEIIGIADWGSIPWDSDLSVNKMLSQSDHLGGYKRLSHIYNIWFTSWFNNARILEPTKPYIIALRYTPAMLGGVHPKDIRLIFSEDEGITWKLLPNTVIDEVNSTAAVTSTKGGYYALVNIK